MSSTLTSPGQTAAVASAALLIVAGVAARSLVRELAVGRLPA